MTNDAGALGEGGFAPLRVTRPGGNRGNQVIHPLRSFGGRSADLFEQGSRARVSAEYRLELPRRKTEEPGRTGESRHEQIEGFGVGTGSKHGQNRAQFQGTGLRDEADAGPPLGRGEGCSPEDLGRLDPMHDGHAGIELRNKEAEQFIRD